MPRRKTKPFIDKNNAVKFHLVHRSQQDPLLTDETAPQHVLLPAATKNSDVEKRKEQQRDFGVFFDDDYNYLQHLQEASRPAEMVSAPTQRGHDAPVQVLHIPAARVQLPSSVFASEFEEKIGLLRRAAPDPGPRPDWDPDIVAALDDDFNFDPEVELEDDFVMKLVAPGGDAEGAGDADAEWVDVEDDGDSDMSYDSDGPAEDGSRGKGRLFMDEETRTRFTDYSLTSSVMHRNDQLTLLDDRFEKFFAAYEEDEIGALDHCEVEGSMPAGSTRLQAALDDFQAREQAEHQRPDSNRATCHKRGARKEERGTEESDDDDDDEMVDVAVEKPAEKWDCESIISTYSNLYNHPKLIEEPSKPVRVSRKTGLPLGVLPQRGPTARQAERAGTVTAAEMHRLAAAPRAHEETPEQRRARKQAVRDERRDRRLEKKANRLAFKEEKARQEKVVLNLRQNLQGVRLT